MLSMYEEALLLIDTKEFDSIEDWNIHSKDYDKKGEVRQGLYAQFTHLSEHSEYGEHPDGPRKLGWSGSISMPVIGIVAFTSIDQKANHFSW